MSDLMPWEKDGEEFNAEVAKTLILNLRSENKALKSEKAELVSGSEAKDAEIQQLNTTVEEQKATLALANEDIESKESAYKDLQTQHLKESLLVDKGLPRDFASYIPSGDEDAMTSAVEKFASLRGADVNRVPFDPAQVAEPSVDPRLEAAQQIFGQ